MGADLGPADTGRDIEVLRQQTAANLRAAAGQREALVVAIRRFLDEGMGIIASPSALWDFFAISHPDLPTQAGYHGTERDRILRIFGTVSWQKFGEGEPPPAGYPH